MSFYQNPFDQEFRGNLVLADRQLSLTFPIAANTNRSDSMIAWNPEPYDLSVDNLLTINYAYDIELKNYSTLSINVAGATPASTKAIEVVTALNSNAVFADLFVASTKFIKDAGVLVPNTVYIRSTKQKSNFRAYITNGGAEAHLGFNLKAHVGELPTYMDRHTIANRFNFPDSLGALVWLDETDPVDQQVIENAGLDPLNMQEDWELLRGRSGMFTFQKITVDGSDRITRIIEYAAGAQVGDFAKRTDYTYTGANLNPSEITEVPHVVATGDLILPPP